MRVNLSVAIVCMVNHTAIQKYSVNNTSIVLSECEASPKDNNTSFESNELVISLMNYLFYVSV